MEIPRVPAQRNLTVLLMVSCSCVFSQSGDLAHDRIEIRGFGGGNDPISRRTGINVEPRGVAVSFCVHSLPGWIVRTTGGFYFRF
jgi:hypothetical protein